MMPGGKLPRGRRFFENSGILVERRGKRLTVIAGKKGGSFQTYPTRKLDCGVRVRKGGKLWATHVQNGKFGVVHKDNKLAVEGPMVEVLWMKSTPFKHLILRVASFLLGGRLASLLKQRMIFLSVNSGVWWRRKIDLKSRVVISEVVSDGEFEVSPGKKYPVRHVASAFSFSVWDERIVGLTKRARGKWSTKISLA
jgi:hypothetical protein